MDSSVSSGEGAVVWLRAGVLPSAWACGGCQAAVMRRASAARAAQRAGSLGRYSFCPPEQVCGRVWVMADGLGNVGGCVLEVWLDGFMVGGLYLSLLGALNFWGERTMGYDASKMSDMGQVKPGRTSPPSRVSPSVRERTGASGVWMSRRRWSGWRVQARRAP